MKLTCEFDRAQYLTGQEIRLYLPEGANAPRVCVYRLEAPIDCSVRQNGRTLILPPLPAGSYGITVEAGSAQWEGAFDVVEDPRVLPAIAKDKMRFESASPGIQRRTVSSVRFGV